MKKIILGKGKGKTTELIKQSAESGDYIICHSLNECSRIQFKAGEMGLNIPFPASYDEFINGNYYSKGIRGFLIDNVDMLLQHMTNVPVNAITITKD